MTNHLTLSHPLFPAFFHAVAVEKIMGEFDDKALSSLVEKPWKWTEEFNLFASCDCDCDTFDKHWNS